MRIHKRLAALALSLDLCCSWAPGAYAHDVPDMTKTGSISAEMLYDGEAVGGGTVTLYKAGDVAEDNGNYGFTLTGDFSGSGASLEDISASGLADRLGEYAPENDLTGTTINISSDGTWMAGDLELGLYLVVQQDAADGFEPIAPFLVSVPMYDEAAGVYNYSVDAQPKLSTLTKTPVPETTAPAAPPASSGGTLPQTGQLNWPVPVLAAAGLGLLIIGWGLHFGRQRKSYEA